MKAIEPKKLNVLLEVGGRDLRVGVIKKSWI